jgi:hypothetical protein
VGLPGAVLAQDTFERGWFFERAEKLPKIFIDHMPVALLSPNLQDEAVLLLDVIWRPDAEGASWAQNLVEQRHCSQSFDRLADQ